MHAAEARDIPWIRLNSQSLIQFGHGRYQQRIQATVTSRTPHIAVELASDKEETNKILGQLGLPVPQQRLAQREDDAVRAAEAIGYPVVVKPYNGNHGRGVALNLMAADQVRAAFQVAQQISRSVVVEKFVTGDDHRMLVVNNELVAVSRRLPGHVVGDGTSTVEQLVEAVNQDPRRGIGHEKVLTRIEFDLQADRLLAERGYTRQSVPASGEMVPLRLTANLSTGGTAEDVTDVVHPDNAEMAVRAIKAIGLDVGGVDFLSSNITESYKDIGGAICEVNAAPGFRMHIAPSSGKPRDVAGAVMDMLFPAGHAEPDPDRRAHRYEREDHDGADAGAHPQAGRPERGDDDHRRRVRGRPVHGEGRHDGAGGDPHGAERSVRGRGGARARARRDAPRGNGRPLLRRGRGAQRPGRPPRASAASRRSTTSLG